MPLLTRSFATCLPLIMFSLVTIQIYHCFQFAGSERFLEWQSGNIPMAANMNNVMLFNHGKLLHTRKQESIPTIKDSFGACLMIKGDNDLLTEWIPYHYTVLPLHYLFVATDYGNTEDPNQVLDRWRVAGTGLNIKVVTISEIENVHGPFKGNLKNGLNQFNRRMKRKGVPPINTTDHPAYQRDVIHHHLIHKQMALISYCTKYMKDLGVQWVTYHDTDEFLVVNHLGLNEVNESSVKVNKDDLTSRTRQFLPPAHANLTVADILNFFETINFPVHSCNVVPRVTVGALENFTCPESKGTVEFAKRNFEDFGVFNTLRFHQHANKDDFSLNRFGKAFVNIARLSSRELSSVPHNVHRPFPESCPRPVTQTSSSLFYLMHYVGGWERFEAKGDARRGYTDWQKRATIVDSTSCCQQLIYHWLPRFINQVGIERAKYLLQATAWRKNTKKYG